MDLPKKYACNERARRLERGWDYGRRGIGHDDGTIPGQIGTASARVICNPSPVKLRKLAE